MPRDLLHAIAARADAFLEHLPGALDGRTRETHQARVAARRLAEALPLVGARGERLAREVRAIRQALGARREIDVVRELLSVEAERYDWAAPVVSRVRRHLDVVHRERRTTSDAVLRRVDTAKLRRAIRAAGDAASRAAPKRITQRLGERRESREAGFQRAVRSVGALYDVERLHRVRLAVKKLRYTLEVAADLGTRRASSRIAALKAMQERLGRLHDLQILQAQIRHVEDALVPGRGRVARGLAAMADNVEADCRGLHAEVLPKLRARLRESRRH